LAIEGRLLNGAASPANCARKIAGPFIVDGMFSLLL